MSGINLIGLTRSELRNFAESIVEKNKEFLESGGHFIVPLPQIKII